MLRLGTPDRVVLRICQLGRPVQGRVSALAFSSDRSILAFGTGAALVADANVLEGNGTIKILDLSSGTPRPHPELTFITGDDQVDLVAH